MLFSIGRAPLAKKKRRGRPSKWHFDELDGPGATLTVHQADEADNAYEAAKSWVRRHKEWRFEYGWDGEGRFVIRRVR